MYIDTWPYKNPWSANIFWSKKTNDCQTSVHQVQSGTVFNPYPTEFPYGNGMVLHFYQQQESSMTKTVHRVIYKGLKTYV